MAKKKNYFEGFDSDSGKAALPEPRKVKRSILFRREKVHEAATKFSVKQDTRTRNKWKKHLLHLYQELRPFLYNYSTGQRDFSDLKNLDTYLIGEDVISKDTLSSFTQKMDLFIHDIGITDINVRQDFGNDFGYEFLKGTPFSMDTRFANWNLLKENFKNVRRLLRNDTDFFGLVIGGNRVGKSTLSLRLTRIVKSGRDEACLTPDNIVMDNKDFWEAANSDQYHAMHIDEMSGLFYSKDHSTKEQKKRKKKLKTFARRNMFAMGCDTSFFQIDKEFVNDKVKCVVRVPKRGFFEFYSKSKVRLFERDSDTGAVDLPSPDFMGRFPKLNDDDWRMYKILEPRKEGDHDEEEEGEEDGGLSKVERAVEKIESDFDRFLKGWGDRIIVNRELVLSELDGVGVDSVRRAKAKVESFISKFLREEDVSGKEVLEDKELFSELKSYLKENL